ncbi:MAG: ABC transporter ATP-binding protein [Phycisphaerales bacterium]
MSEATKSGVGVRVVDARRRFGSVEVIAGISLDVGAGSFVSLIGPSGCGKTTLLRAIGGVESLDAGTISYASGDGAPLGLHEAGVAFCFQEPRLLPWRNVRANVELPLELAGVAPSERAARASEAIERMRLADAGDRLPAQLSGGMRMRAAMARALVTRPRLLLLDEPFGALDEVTRSELDEELRELQAAERFTAILVTHSLYEAVYLSDRVDVFSPRPARRVLDESIAFATRDDAIRTSDQFNLHVRRISEALHAAMRGASPARSAAR